MAFRTIGLSMLTSLDGTSRTIVAEHDCGVPFSSATELNKAVASYLNDMDKIKRQRENALRLFHEQFEAGSVYMGFAHEVEGLARLGGRPV